MANLLKPRLYEALAHLDPWNVKVNLAFASAYIAGFFRCEIIPMGKKVSVVVPGFWEEASLLSGEGGFHATSVNIVWLRKGKQACMGFFGTRGQRSARSLWWLYARGGFQDHEQMTRRAKILIHNLTHLHSVFVKQNTAIEDSP